MSIEPVPEYAPSTDENPYVGDLIFDPFPFYGRMRAREPIIWLEKVGVWGAFVDDVSREILMDHDRFGNAGGGGVANYYREKPWREPSVVFEVDPPDHTRTRKVLSRLLSPRTVRELSDKAEALANDAVAKARSMGQLDFFSEIAKPYVLQIIPDAVGIPEEDRENIITYNKYMIKGRTFGRHEPWTDAELEESERVVNWVSEMCNRDSISSDGLGAEIYKAADAGEISMHEANMLIRSFLSAGTDTTFGAISNAMYFLLSNRPEWEKLVADPSLARNAYDEGLRYRSPAQTIARNTRMEMDFHGVHMNQYDKIIVFVGSANRDPNRWDDPDEYRVDRKVTGQLGLGIGIHGCVGQMVARMEGEKLLGAFASSGCDIDLGEEQFEWAKSGRYVGKLPITVS